MEKQMVQVTADKISKLTGFAPEEIAVIKNTVAKNTTDVELAFFLSVAKSSGLNPFMKEIWCYKDNKGNLLTFAGRDGFLKKAQESPLWNGMTSSEVCDNDDFNIDIISGHATHKPDYKNRGQILGAYAIVKPKGCELPTIEWASWEKYNKGKFTWVSHPEDMIKKVAETHALKKAYGITGLQSEYDFDVQGGVVVPLQDEEDELETAKKLIREGLDIYKGEDKEAIKAMCIQKAKAGEFDLVFAKEIAKQIRVEL